MGLADRLEEDRAASKRPNAAERALAKLSPEDMAVLLEAAADESWSNTRLREILAREGVNVPRDAFAKWRRNVTGR